MQHASTLSVGADGNAFAVQAVDYVVQHFTAQEQAAKREYMARKRLRESLAGKVSRLDPSDKDQRDALISKVLSDCEELSALHLAEAWSNEKRYSLAFDILRDGLGHPGETVQARNQRFAAVREPDPRKVQMRPSFSGSGAGRPGNTTSRPSSATSAGARAHMGFTAAAPAPGGGARRPRPASATPRMDTGGRLPGDIVSKSATAAAAKPWRAAMTRKDIKRIERRNRKKDSAPARLARASKKVRGRSGGDCGSGAGRIKKKKGKKLVPKLQMFPTYGPQNVAARALRKYKGRTLNPETSYQFTVTRAKQHLARSAEAKATREQQDADKARQIRERLQQLDARAKRTVAQFAQAPPGVSAVASAESASPAGSGTSSPVSFRGEQHTAPSATSSSSSSPSPPHRTPPPPIVSRRP